MKWRPLGPRILVVASLLLGVGRGRRVWSQAISINPNHAGHTKAGVECLTCHETIFDETALGQPGAFPKEAKCLSCHKKQKEEGKCGMCHLAARTSPAPTS